ncbi:MAG: hypothetical protein KVP17_002076 [Porospora cf. gigantea B]|uniref:uncharacterized protein n=1 Tax=Porospora cf. gigantea B TaxID=2853592 RepID=UPI003571A6F2|nr:MAG: hypothetical protein KVP17_002076 [Porospora cf. gigantea B]
MGGCFNLAVIFFVLGTYGKRAETTPVFENLTVDTTCAAIVWYGDLRVHGDLHVESVAVLPDLDRAYEGVEALSCEYHMTDVGSLVVRGLLVVVGGRLDVEGQAIAGDVKMASGSEFRVGGNLVGQILCESSGRLTVHGTLRSELVNSSHCDLGCGEIKGSGSSMVRVGGGSVKVEAGLTAAYLSLTSGASLRAQQLIVLHGMQVDDFSEVEVLEGLMTTSVVVDDASTLVVGGDMDSMLYLEAVSGSRVLVKGATRAGLVKVLDGSSLESKGTLQVSGTLVIESSSDVSVTDVASVQSNAIVKHSSALESRTVLVRGTTLLEASSITIAASATFKNPLLMTKKSQLIVGGDLVATGVTADQLASISTEAPETGTTTDAAETTDTSSETETAPQPTPAVLCAWSSLQIGGNTLLANSWFEGDECKFEGAELNAKRGAVLLNLQSSMRLHGNLDAGVTLTLKRHSQLVAASVRSDRIIMYGGILEATICLTNQAAVLSHSRLSSDLAVSDLLRADGKSEITGDTVKSQGLVLNSGSSLNVATCQFERADVSGRSSIEAQALKGDVLSVDGHSHVVTATCDIRAIEHTESSTVDVGAASVGDVVRRAFPASALEKESADFWQ